MLSFRLPAARLNAAFLELEDQRLYSYTPVGRSAQAEPVAGFDNDFQRVVIGQGADDFERAKAAVRNWQMFPTAWTRILPEQAPIREAETVAMYARAFGLWWRNSCRIVYTIDEPTRFGFAYGTLPAHVEKGEELFLVELADDGAVWYTIRAYSRPRHLLARLGYPLMRYFQERFRRDSAEQMSARVKRV
jgi:uncharacterized protein (UPF0548 family)